MEETFEMSQKELEVCVCDLIEKEIKVMQFKDDLKIKKKQIKKAIKKDPVQLSPQWRGVGNSNLNILS